MKAWKERCYFNFLESTKITELLEWMDSWHRSKIGEAERELYLGM